MSTALRLLPAVRRATCARSSVLRNAYGRRSFSARSQLLEKKYASSHEWVEVDASGKIATVGISEYAQSALGDVVYVELPEENLELNKGDELGAVESVKSASDVYAPVSGKVIESNKVLEETPATINKSAEGDGWLAKIELSKPEELDDLKTKAEYDAMEKGGDDH